MTKNEVAKLLMTMQTFYPNYQVENKELAINAWHTLVGEYDYQAMMMALKAYITTDASGFAPSIGQLLDKLHTIQNPQELNEMEAWSLVSKALRNGYYGAVEEFSKLPPLVQKAVGSPDNLRNWSQTDQNSIENVVQSNFMRSYRIVVNREKEIEKMPSDVKTLIENVNKTSYSAQISSKNEKAINSTLNETKRQIGANKCVTTPKERIEQIRREE